MPKTTLLDKVRTALSRKTRQELLRLAAASDVGFDTVLRIRNGASGDPGYSKVQRLADHMGIK